MDFLSGRTVRFVLVETIIGALVLHLAGCGEPLKDAGVSMDTALTEQKVRGNSAVDEEKREVEGADSVLDKMVTESTGQTDLGAGEEKGGGGKEADVVQPERTVIETAGMGDWGNPVDGVRCRVGGVTLFSLDVEEYPKRLEVVVEIKNDRERAYDMNIVGPCEGEICLSLEMKMEKTAMKGQWMGIGNASWYPKEQTYKFSIGPGETVRLKFTEGLSVLQEREIRRGAPLRVVVGCEDGSSETKTRQTGTVMLRGKGTPR
jgi:hypothetical protein